MSMAKRDRINVIPGLRYADAPEAIRWLCEAFGFEERLVVPGAGEGEVAHAELVFGNGMIMLGSAGIHPGGYEAFMATPDQMQGRNTQSVYVVVDEPKAHCERAVAAGAEIVLPLEEKPYGGSGYSCRDPEGNIWSFGDYAGELSG